MYSEAVTERLSRGSGIKNPGQAILTGVGMDPLADVNKQISAG